MVELQRDMEYPVLVTECDGGFELRIRELLLSVRAPDLQQAYDKLLSRKQEVADWACAIGELDELPPPDLPPPLLGKSGHRATGLYRASLAALSRIGIGRKRHH